MHFYGTTCTICISVNDTLIHGIPSKKIILRDGDIVSLDVGATYQGYCGDACRTYPVGICKESALRLIKVTEESFFEAIKVVKDGALLGDVSATIQEYNEKHGYSLPRDYTGHGIGTHLHEDPQIPNYGRRGTGSRFREGMVIAIEPMITLGNREVVFESDGWTCRTADYSPAAHMEHDVAITENGPEILSSFDSIEKAIKQNINLEEI